MEEFEELKSKLGNISCPMGLLVKLFFDIKNFNLTKDGTFYSFINEIYKAENLPSGKELVDIEHALSRRDEALNADWKRSTEERLKVNARRGKINKSTASKGDK